MTSTIGHSTRLHLHAVRNLPPLPEASIQIINAVNDPDIEVEQLVKVINMTPSLVARLLGLANSAFFGQADRICDLRKAIIQVLGLNLVKSLSLSIALNANLDVGKCKAFEPQRYWWQSLSTALLAQKLAIKCKDKSLDPAVVYTSGLLLDIGLLAAVFLEPDATNALFLVTQKKQVAVHDGFKTVFGFSHYKIGFHLLEHWGLPEVFQGVLRHFEEPSFDGAERNLIRLLQLSGMVSRQVCQNKPVERNSLAKTQADLGVDDLDLNDAIEKLESSNQDIQELAAVFGG